MFSQRATLSVQRLRPRVRHEMHQQLAPNHLHQLLQKK